MHWPGGPGTNLQLDGVARDLFTPIEGEPAVVAEGSMAVTVGAGRVIANITVTPESFSAGDLLGAQGGSRLRDVVDTAAAVERDAGTPLYLLLDDIPGATLIAGFAWSRWRDALANHFATNGGANHLARLAAAAKGRQMEGICAGFRPGSSSLAPGGFLNTELDQNVAVVPPIADADDPIGWHDMPGLRAEVLSRLRGTDCCTHLNDALRSLAEVPVLLAQILLPG
jgi:hypothetical protein